MRKILTEWKKASEDVEKEDDHQILRKDQSISSRGTIGYAIPFSM